MARSPVICNSHLLFDKCLTMTSTVKGFTCPPTNAQVDGISRVKLIIESYGTIRYRSGESLLDRTKNRYFSIALVYFTTMLRIVIKGNISS